MIVKLLMVDNQPDGDDFIDNPTWEDIEEALNNMDGQNKTYLGFYKNEEPNDEEFLMVGGGNGKQQFVCCYYNEGEEFYVLNQNEKDPDTVVDVPIGQMGRKKKKYINNLDAILDPVKFFYKTGTMSPDVTWQKV